MSYDLMAFESDKAPKKYKDFLRWYDEQTEWNGEHDYNNPSLASDSLQGWYGEMVQTFPNMNLPSSPTLTRVTSTWRIMPSDITSSMWLSDGPLPAKPSNAPRLLPTNTA